MHSRLMPEIATLNKHPRKPTVDGSKSGLKRRLTRRLKRRLKKRLKKALEASRRYSALRVPNA